MKMRSLANAAFFRIGALLLLCIFSGCAAAPPPQASEQVQALFVTLGGTSNATLRVLTTAPDCPVASIVPGHSVTTALRAAASGDVRRLGSAAPAKFDVNVCEARLPPATQQVMVAGRMVYVGIGNVRRIVLLGDTGCRLKAAEGSIQDCNDPTQWRFAEVAASAARLAPDLVIHLGDIHYRESPCPDARAGCRGSPWGYGWDAWHADFFEPARPLLAVAPWVFVRGNHESCSRAGQGWFRFIDNHAFEPELTCNRPADDAVADFLPPYAVPLDAQTQLIVFDSSRSGARAYQPNEPAFQQYQATFRQVDALAQRVAHSFFLSHHPVLGFSPHGDVDAKHPEPTGKALLSVMQTLHPEHYFPSSVDMAFHGHVHLFEALSFASGHPATFVIGNGGSLHPVALPAALPPELMPAPTAVIASFATDDRYGFATLDKTSDGWQLTARDVQGQAFQVCDIQGRIVSCREPS